MIAPIGSIVILTDELRDKLVEIGFGKYGKGLSRDSLRTFDKWRAKITGSPKKNREDELVYPARLIIPPEARHDDLRGLEHGETFPLRDSEFELEAFSENKKMDTHV